MAYIKEQPSYFRTVYGRGRFKLFFLYAIFAILTPFRLILEVFIRRRMGERYFSNFFCLFWSLIFLSGFVINSVDLIPYAIPEPYASSLNTVGIFGVIFLGFSIWRGIESYQHPSTVRFDRFSKSSGEPTLFFKSLLDKGTSPRLIEIWLEPLLFVVIGGVLLLSISTRLLGAFLILCSIMYALSYWSAYAISRHYMLDIIDEKISTQGIGEAVKSGFAGTLIDGFLNRAPVAESEDHKEHLYRLIMRSDPTGEPTSVAQ